MTKQKKKNVLDLNISLGGITPLQKAVFAKNLSLMLKSGLDIIEALHIIASQSTGKFKSIIDDIIIAVESGNSLANSFKKHSKVFSPIFVNTTLAGESSGTLADNLENLSNHLKRNNEVISKIKGAMVYPIIVIIGAFGLGTVLSFVVLPKIIPLFEGLNMDLPLTTKLLIAFSHFIENHRIALLVGLFFGIFFIQWLLRQKWIKPITHYILLKIPVINNLVINSNLANFCNTLGMLLKSGLIIDEALSITKEVVSNYYYKRALEDVHKKTIQGNKLSDNLNNHPSLFPKMVVSMIKVGERSGNLENSLFHLSEYYDTEIDVSTKTLSTAIEPILLMLIGLFVGLLAVSIITPIYKLTGNVSR
jgi:type IV pilus assembly protein PilC